MKRFRDLIGKPFRDFGRGPEAYDCLGICIEGSRRLGLELPDYGSMDSHDSPAIDDAVTRVREAFFFPVYDPQPGDLVTMSTTRWTVVDHLGLVVGKGFFLHCTRPLGVLLTSLNDPFWGPMIFGFYRRRPTKFEG